MAVPAFIFASSSSVYGPETPLSAEESTPASPCSPHALTKPRQGVTASARPLVRPDGRRDGTVHDQPMTSHPQGQPGSAEAVRPYPPPDKLRYQGVGPRPWPPAR
ncbi:MAG: hypothetical protein NTW21_09635 [Verrucomicrobia bacterium]|nr:hypothetical protein [Verrucomicrobiota bacterium]